MSWGFADITLSPLVPWPVLAVPAALFVVLAAVAVVRRARGAWWRILPLAAIILALLDPRLAGEEREPLDDVAVVVVDRSQSQTIGDRPAQTEQALQEVTKRLERLPGLEVRVEQAVPQPGADEGTRLFSALGRALSDVPRRRLAGAIMITDGQVHDLPEGREQALGAPLHVLLTGHKGERDRRLVVEQAPSFGIVGTPAQIKLRVDEPGASGSAKVTVRRDGGRPVTMSVPLNASRTVEVPIDHGGPMVVELDAEAGPQELTLVNNRTAVTINGVRDRLRVLLVSGEPHPGERTWRNLLKSDPSVDLVHFTILRPPEKDDATPIKELALISFPIRELFEEKLKDFDLIIFDRYRRRALMPVDYYKNIADYVRDGGALLMAVGPEAADGFDLHSTPLESVLPARPDGQLLAEGFLPLVTEVGKRHPVTAGLPGAQGPKPDWGRWLRLISTTRHSGTEVMSGAEGRPLLVLDHVGEGRVAQLLSDTVWLWSRGFEGGGPQAELLRRLAHWLMKEPALDEETLRAEVRGEELVITRRSLTPGAAKVTVTLPDDSKRTVTLEDQGDGRELAALPLEQTGLYRVTDGVRTAVTAAGSLNPLEMAELAATDQRLKPVVEANGGGLVWLADGGVPELRRVGKDDRTAGRGWLGLRANGEHVVTAIRDLPLMPATLLLLLTLGGLIIAWWREGR
jgi:hypothetical protein